MGEIEQALRDHVRAAGGVRGFHFRSLSGEVQFWPDSRSLIGIPYVAGDCQRIACDARERFPNLRIASGWVLDLDGNPAWHNCNISPSGELVDVGRSHHQPGMVGKILSEAEAATLARAAGQRSTAEIGEAGRSLGHAFSALLG